MRELHPVLLAITMNSCNVINSGVFQSVSVLVYVVDTNGNDLLNPQLSGTLKSEDIRIEFQKKSDRLYFFTTSKPSIGTAELDRYVLVLHPSNDREPPPYPEA
ncbi:MAG: hypothetical protein ACI9DJ_003245 [Algoriphagus sp.]|jgi:hypothetical protein